MVASRIRAGLNFTISSEFLRVVTCGKLARHTAVSYARLALATISAAQSGSNYKTEMYLTGDRNNVTAPDATAGRRKAFL
jgi:hypothetical protein